MGLKEGHRPWSVQFGEPLELFDPPTPELQVKRLWPRKLRPRTVAAQPLRAQDAGRVVDSPQDPMHPALTARSSFLRAPSPGHVRKDYGRSHPPEVPCPAQVCTSAHWLGCMLPTPQPLEAFPGDPGTQRTLLALPPHHLTAVASAASHRAPHPAPQRGCLLDGCLSETLFLRGRGVLGTAVSRVPTQHVPERAVTGSVLLLILTSTCPPTGLWVSCGQGPHFLSEFLFIDSGH